jgi:isoleucyl-tRNA synthetase
MKVPADIYLEGSDQHRGWFNTSLLSSMASHNRIPFKALVTHGFVTDSAGMKMSKSKGNTVDPQVVSAQSGAEILRLWSIYEDYGQDLTCGKTELDRVTETYRRIRNTIKFLLGATSDFNPKTDSIKYSEMTQIDQWALAKLYELTTKVTAAYDEYSFYKIYHLLNNFFTVELSSVYLDILKDRLYTWKPNGLPRRSSQTALHTILDYLVRIMAPVLSFLSEETYSHFKDKNLDSVFLLDYPTPPEQWNNKELVSLYETLLNVRSEVQKAVEPLRAQKTIGASLEAHVEITTDAKTLAAINACADFREVLIVSKLITKEGPVKLEVQKAAGEKCVRCWTYSTDISPEQKLPGICPKCVEALT